MVHLVGTHLAVFSALQHAQQERLALQRKLGNLVQEKGAAVGLFEIALAGFHGAGERALDVAEELGVHEFPGQGTAVHREKGVLPAGAELVDDAGETFLAHTALSLDEDAEAGRGEFHRRLQRFVQRRIVADDVVFIL